MQHSNRFPVAPQQPVEVHETRHVVARDHLAASSQVILDTIASHKTRHAFLGDRERAAKATAFIGASQVGELDVRHELQQLTNLRIGGPDPFARTSQPQFAEAMAALMNTDSVWKANIKLVDLQHIHQKLAQLIGPPPGIIVPSFIVRRVTVRRVTGLVQHVGIMVPDHRNAAPRWTDDVVVWLEDTQVIASEWRGRGNDSRVRHRLPTAGLSRGELHFAAQPP